jgi:uncharacterized protein YjbI with pentapeptide repeats
MTTAARSASFDRRTFGCLMAGAVSLPGAVAFGSSARKLSVREVVRTLMDAKEGTRPAFAHQDLSGLNLADLDFLGADLSRCNLFGADFTDSNLEGADLTGSVLDRCTLVRTRLSNAILQDASMRRPSVFSDMRFDARDLPMFHNANMAGVRLTARLDGADFRSANLRGANFTVWEERGTGGAPTTGLIRCDFTGAVMTGANVRGLSLALSVFRNVDLTGADLRDTDFSGADLTGATLTGAKVEGAKFDGVIGRTATP